MHFLVDGLCVCCLYQVVRPLTWVDFVPVFVTYNVLAFLTQPLTGWLADVVRQRHWLLIASVMLLTTAVLTASAVGAVEPVGMVGLLAVAVLLGMGNSLFHVWGGKLVAMTTGNDIRALGVFVSTGAFGLAVGVAFGSWPLLYAMLLAIALLAAWCVSGEACPTLPKGGEASGKACPFKGGMLLTVCTVVALMGFVMLRSLVGESFSSGVAGSLATSQTELAVVMLSVGFVAMAGKMAGGWIALRMGVVRAFIFMLIAVAACMGGVALVGGEPALPLSSLRITGLWLVNCTMPITLYWANAVMRDREGLAFGLLAAALMPGYLLA